MKFFLNMGIDVSLAYGLTELGAPLAVTGRGYYPGTTGRVLRHTEKMDIRVVNPDEKGRGEVEILSPYRMISYLESEDNEGCFTEDGYFRTGDIGEFTKDGRLALKGRIKTMILGPAGENIFPESIEFLINAEEDVLESLVIADEHGQLLAMIRLDIRALKRKGIVAVGEIENYLSQIKERVNEKLSSFSKIRSVEIQNEPFERTPSEKIKRFLYQRKKTNK